MFLVTNKIANINFASVQESFESIYEDRLLANNHILKISYLMQTKIRENSYLNRNEKYEFNDHYFDSLETLLTKYSNTKFSEKETLYFNAIKEKVMDLKSLEKNLETHDDPEERGQITSAINHKTLAILDDLEILSEIQITEGKALFDSSNKRINTSYLTYRLESALLIIFALLVLVLISVKPKPASIIEVPYK